MVTETNVSWPPAEDAQERGAARRDAPELAARVGGVRDVLASDADDHVAFRQTRARRRAARLHAEDDGADGVAIEAQPLRRSPA